MINIKSEPSDTFSCEDICIESVWSFAKPSVDKLSVNMGILFEDEYFLLGTDMIALSLISWHAN